eukprot:195119-Pyramimonas_sp.AAC.1
MGTSVGLRLRVPPPGGPLGAPGWCALCRWPSSGPAPPSLSFQGAAPCRDVGGLVRSSLAKPSRGRTMLTLAKSFSCVWPG